MRTVRICIGSEDGVNIASTHMGDTGHFYIYDLGAAGYTFVEQRNNIAQDLDHAGADKMKEILSLVGDADVLIAQQKSPNFIKIARQTKYQPLVVKVDTIQAIFTLLQGEFEKIYSYVERRRNGDTFETILELTACS
ncbi:MAG: NifB/NifX family molybdenum-iron cluster-binding protein [Desulfuromusa sp.]|nr:NifB/NifX family molybdenum-iron cluster-binding protein [Desulfuromusa sp.]